MSLAMTAWRRCCASPALQGFGLWLLVGLPLLLVIGGVLLPGVPDVLPSGDDAVIELFTWHSLHGLQLEGIRCQDDGAQHLGPIYFYVLAPFYWLSRCTYHGLTVAHALINLAAIAGVLLVAWRCAGRALAVWAAVLLMLYMRFMSMPWLAEVWTPWIVILPFIATMFLLSAVATGRLWYLPGAAATCSFIVQTQMGYSLTLAVVALAALTLGITPRMARLLRATNVSIPPSVASFWRPILATLVVSGICWILPAVKQLSGQPGNLVETIRFFAENSGWRSWAETGKALSLVGAAFPLSLVGRDLKPAMQAFETRSATMGIPLWYASVASLPVLVLPIAFWLARRRARGFEAAMSLLTALGTVACVVSVGHIVGAMALHYYFWMSSVSLLCLFVLGAALLPHLVDRLPMYLRCRLDRPCRITVMASLVALGAANLGSTLAARTHIEHGCPHDDSMATDARPLVEHCETILDRRQSQSLLLRVMGLHHCGPASGLIVGLTKAGYQVCLDPQLATIFSPRHALDRPVHDLFILCSRSVGHRLAQRSELTLIQQTPEVMLFWNPDPGSLRGRYDADELQALALVREGFYAPEQDADGTPFCWSEGPQSRILADLEAGRAYRISVTAEPLLVAGKKQQIKLFFNGRSVATWNLDQPKWQPLEVIVPGHEVRRRNELIFCYGYVASPPDAPHNDDLRRLAVRYRHFSFEPLR